jgi:hypothetical protein
MDYDPNSAFGFGGTPNVVPPGWRPPLQPQYGQAPGGQVTGPPQPLQSLQQQNGMTPSYQPKPPQQQLSPQLIQQALALGGSYDQLANAEGKSKDADYQEKAGTNYGSQKGGWLRSIGDMVSDVTHAITKKSAQNNVDSSLARLNAQQQQAYTKFMDDLQKSQGLPPPTPPPGQPMPQSAGVSGSPSPDSQGGAFSF